MDVIDCEIHGIETQTEGIELDLREDTVAKKVAMMIIKEGITMETVLGVDNE
mgnify:CR=1 FL=1|jgi:hypothetical protein